MFRFLSKHTTLTYVFCRKNRCHEIHFFGEMDYFLDWSLVSQGNNGISPLFVIIACRRGKAFLLQSVSKDSGPASLFSHMLHFDVLCFFAKLPQASWGALLGNCLVASVCLLGGKFFYVACLGSPTALLAFNSLKKPPWRSSRRSKFLEAGSTLKHLVFWHKLSKFRLGISP